MHNLFVCLQKPTMPLWLFIWVHFFWLEVVLIMHFVFHMKIFILSLFVLFVSSQGLSFASDVKDNSQSKTVKDKEKRVFNAPEGFEFGLAGAPAHLEDGLDDIWLDYARKGGVAAFDNVGFPEKRLNFWSEPERELDLVAATGVSSYRLGVDWGRIFPTKPVIRKDGSINLSKADINWSALERYKEIILLAKSRGLNVMVSLFHHSIPKWLMKTGGWKNKDSIVYFEAFTRVVVENLAGQIDDWVTFNEPAVFAALTYAAGIWPPGGEQDNLAFLRAFGIKGSFKKALDNMAEAHKNVYVLIKEKDRISANGKYYSNVGIAHNVALYTANKFLDNIGKKVVTYNLVWEFPDKVIGFLDFMGINYYGEEIVTGTTVVVDDRREYSESGRTINPNGLYILVKKFDKEYNTRNRMRKKDHPNFGKKIPFIITENGVSDTSDILRPAFLVEHLKAVGALIGDGVDIRGYYFWTVSDNWEWADGYCPKFGLFSVDRSTTDLRRIPRPSFYLFRDIVTNRNITMKQSREAWLTVVKSIGVKRPFCRASDGKTSLDVPVLRDVSNFDWRFKAIIPN
jgi:galactolipid galactosyltransferase